MNAVDSAERFFLDIIGSVIPGGVLLVGVAGVSGWNMRAGQVSLSPTDPQGAWILFVAASYVFGHSLAPLAGALGRWLFQNRVQEHCRRSSNYRQFLQVMNRAGVVSSETIEMTDLRDLRSIAMTLVPTEKPTIYRFTFLYLMNGGLAVAVLLICATWMALEVGGSWGLPLDPPGSWWVLLLGILALPFLERQRTFFRISQKVPFSMALAEISKPHLETAARGVENQSIENPTTRKGLTVYLAGGFHSGWQDQFIMTMPHVRFVDPRQHGIQDSSEYAVWDLLGIRQSDVVLAFLERDNPGVYALSLEVGYAKALGKMIVLVDEAEDEQDSRYTDMLRAVSDVRFTRVADARKFLGCFPSTTV